MVINQSMKRLLGSIALVAAGLFAGFGLFVCAMFMLAIAGFYTLSFGTGCFLALILWIALAAISTVMSRRRPAEFSRQWRLFLAAMLAFHVVSCVAAVVLMPETVLFWPTSR